MAAYLTRRVLSMVLTLILIVVVSFIIIQLPPGDFVDNYVAQLRSLGGGTVSDELVQSLKDQYGLNEPVMVQFYKWVEGFPRGDFGISMTYDGAPVADIISLRVGMTLLLVILTLIISWGLAIPFGIYAATHKNKFGDYLLSSISFLGISVPNFLLAVGYLFFAVFVFDSTYVGGLFSNEYADASWSWAKLWDLAKHIPGPLAILGFNGMAGTFRIMRANLLDVLDQQFVETARAKGLRERIVVYRHAVRIAINPLISRLGMQLPVLVGASVIVAIVMDLPTLGPVFYRALLQQDMYMAGTVLMILAIILLVGNLIADFLLAWSDPRIRYD